MNQQQFIDNSQTINSDKTAVQLPRWLSGAGFVIGISYPVLGISTFFRALYQLFLKEETINYVGPALTAVASTCYLIATIGFFVRKRWAWKVSMAVLLFETAMCLIVGTLSLLYPDAIGSTAWRAFGIDYGFFPLIQPILGLLWLWHPTTRAAYEVGSRA